ncbi:MAG: hypothetical protein DWQ34_23980 [Planctomycetota bacterium]|nr:MAG: hypothetical protein DWQ29_17840 [Planctomycetota bacterium]REJ87711.1 MAG: hypothetical protein DWQ34_23980 [Planctomycetota bacterium]REK27794.1 MAG: hypothetical protein DWQ41_06730 [Planctomycetota bacterium]REK34420.1 MAG: hypothetical protein DWQ45_13285 [Planctomycetota bacterium]
MEGESINLQRDRLFQALAQFEATVEAPCVPGDLEGWFEAVDVAFQRLRPMVVEQVERIHPQQFSAIGQEDEELFRRVERMQQEDAALRKEFDQLGDDIATLERSAENLEPDEAKLREAFDGFVDKAIQCIIRVRTQEEAVRTWLMESFTRDRGAVD